MLFTESIIMRSCDRCDRRIPESDRSEQDWLLAQVSVSQAPHDTNTHHLCPECRIDLGKWLQKGPDHPLAEWERELLAVAPSGEVILDHLEEILYPISEYRDSQWDGADVCADVATILKKYRPDAPKRQSMNPNDPYNPLDFVEGIWDRTAAECGEAHEWMWDRVRTVKGTSNPEMEITRYCRSCGVTYISLAKAEAW